MGQSAKNTEFYLYKYTSVETAIKILSNGKLRFSSPAMFNDPFDGQCMLKCPFSEEQIISRLFKIGIDRHSTGRALLPIRPLLKFINNIIANNNISSTTDLSYESCLKQVVDFYRMYDQFWGHQDDTHHKLGNIDFAVKFQNFHRICSMSARIDQIAMWSHYADEHRGVCLQFASNNLFANDKITLLKVLYSEELPAVDNIDFWAMAASANYHGSIMDEITKYLTAKSMQWQNEVEWRYIYWNNDQSDDLTFSQSFDVNSLRAVYLGVRTSERDMERFKSLLRGEYKNCMLYKCNRSKSQFALTYDELNK